MTRIKNQNPVTLIQAKDYKITKWKNGRGQSAEIAIDPPNATFPDEEFVWRLSSAQVTEAGPFSEFPSYRRFLTIVDGGGLKLHFSSSQREMMLRAGETAEFSGDESVSCGVPDGPVTDLNLIYRKDQVKAGFEVIKFSFKPRSFQLEGKVTFLFGISGSLSVEIYPGMKKMTIDQGDTLKLELGPHEDPEERMVLLEPKKSHCQIAWIELDSLSRT